MSLVKLRRPGWTCSGSPLICPVWAQNEPSLKSFKKSKIGWFCRKTPKRSSFSSWTPNSDLNQSRLHYVYSQWYKLGQRWLNIILLKLKWNYFINFFVVLLKQGDEGKWRDPKSIWEDALDRRGRQPLRSHCAGIGLQRTASDHREQQGQLAESVCRAAHRILSHGINLYELLIECWKCD